MPEVFARYRPAGYTIGEFVADMIAVWTEVMGEPTYYGDSSATYEGVTATSVQWPNYGNLVRYWSHGSGEIINFGIASSALGSGSSRVYKNGFGFNSIDFNDFNQGYPLYIVGVKGEDYQLVAYKSYRYRVAFFATLQGAPEFWGSNPKSYASNLDTAFWLLGYNPWGSIDGSGDVSNSGIYQYSIDTTTNPSYPNTVNGNKYELVKGFTLACDEGYIGFLPDDFGALTRIAYTFSMSDFRMATISDDEKYLILPGQGGRCVRVDEAPFPNMPTFSAYVFDRKQPAEGGSVDPGGECEPEWPSYGQTIPNPRALKMRRVTP